MKCIIFRKINNLIPPSPEVIELDQENLDVSLQKLFVTGTLLLVQNNDYQIAGPVINQLNVMDCSYKKENTELYRALKLHFKSDVQKPRKLKTRYTGIAAFKRSLDPFLRRFKSEHPLCILYVEDEIVLSLIEQVKTDNNKTRKTQESEKGQNPLLDLITESEQNKVIQKLEKILLGETFSMRFIRFLIYKASQSVSHVLILGESGSGKELIAKQIFENSTNYQSKYVVVNCSTLQDTLLESELFGHEKGAFTSASKLKEGIFEEVNGGTLFLDEIGDLSLANQAKILRVMENNEIRRLGSNKVKEVNVRVIAATNRNLQSMIAQNKFREDLYFRLNGFTIISPPLRDHPEDIPLLARKYWNGLHPKIPLTSEFLKYLQGYHWPGNVRELRGVFNNISDIFEFKNNESPTAKHVEAIRAYRQDDLNIALSQPEGDFDRMITVQSKMRLIEVENILRGIKIGLRPFINASSEKTFQINELQKFYDIAANAFDKLEIFCKEPLFFVETVLFNRIERFKEAVYKLIKKQTDNPGKIMDWHSGIEKLYDDIESDIFRIVWGKVEVH